MNHNHILQKQELDDALSFSLLRQPEVLADPYPLYRRMRTNDPVHWDQRMDAWIVTSYADVATVLRQYLEGSVWTLQQVQALDVRTTTTFADIMLRTLLHMNPPEHTRTRILAAHTFTGAGLLRLRLQLQKIAECLIDAVQETGQMDVVADFAMPLPTMFMAESLNAPISDRERLSRFSADFSQMLDDFTQYPGRACTLLNKFDEIASYVRTAIAKTSVRSSGGLIHSLLTAQIGGHRFTEEEVIAQFLAMTVGGYKMAVGLIVNAILTLLRNPKHRERILRTSHVLPAAIAELLRFESPRQYAVRFAPEDVALHGKLIRKQQPVIAILGAGNRDPEHFAHPDELDFDRADNDHLAFDWAAYSHASATLVSLQGQIAIETLLTRLPRLKFAEESLAWRDKGGFRELVTFPVTFSASKVRKRA